MWFWRKKQAAKRRRKKRNLSWEELNANDARRVVLETSKKDVEFRKYFVNVWLERWSHPSCSAAVSAPW